MAEKAQLEALRRRGCEPRDVELAKHSRLVCLALEQGKRRLPARQR